MDVVPSWTETEGADRARSLFRDTFGAEPDGVWAAPGRVNLIGEHVDYNGGLCLPIALPHRTYVAMRLVAGGATTDGAGHLDVPVRMVSTQSDHVPWEGTLDDLGPDMADLWAAYAAGPARVMAEDGYRIAGFEAAIDSCVPLSAGLSSSAAVECAMALALNDLNDLGLDAPRLAELCVRAENSVAGAPTGGMDQAAAMRTAPDHAILLDSRDDSVRQVELGLADHGLALVVIDTRAHHALADGQYGQRRATCEAVARRFGIPTLGESPDPRGMMRELLAAKGAGDPRSEAGVAVRRVRHALTEIERVREFVDLLEQGRIAEVGPILDASHASLRDDYEVSCQELDIAVEAARSAGALGARMTGGGFGGSAIALVPEDRVQDVMTAVEEDFIGHGLPAPACLVARAAGPAARIDS